MSNVTIERAGELARSVFEILWEKPEGLSAREVLARIPRVTRLTAEDLKLSADTGLPRYEKTVRIAVLPMAQAGWLKKNEKGGWQIAPEGYDACERFANVGDFYREALRLYEERRRAIPDSVLTLETAQEAAWEQIKRRIQSLHPGDMREMTSELLRAMGYYPAWNAPPEKQRGKVDLVAYADPIGAKGRRILAQIKHKGQPVTLEGVKSFAAMLGQNDFGLIVATGGFTGEATQELMRFERITALDPQSFFDLWLAHYEKIKSETRRRLEVKAVYFLLPNE